MKITRSISELRETICNSTDLTCIETTCIKTSCIETTLYKNDRY